MGVHTVVARLSGPDGATIVECACGRGFTSDTGRSGPVEQQRRHARQEVAQTAQNPASAETGELLHRA